MHCPAQQVKGEYMSEERFNIQLRIAGKSFPLEIERADEERYRRAEREVNDLVARYKSTFRGETEDYLAMTALQMAKDKVTLLMERSLGEELDNLIELEKKLERCVRSEG